MLQTNFLIPTTKELPSSAHAKSHILMLQAGYVKQVSAGVYTYLPIALKIIKKIEQIIREEIDKIGGVEILMPILTPAELWAESGRLEKYGTELMHLQDKNDRHFLLGPTHEETVIDTVRNYAKSYKILPLNLYQIQTKLRDETRPRFGLIRAREFIMFDGYSFHETASDLNQTYNLYISAYEQILTRLKLNYKKLNASSGLIGGDTSMEFMIPSQIGEDYILWNDQDCFNLEIAPLPQQLITSIQNEEITNAVTYDGKTYQIDKGIEVGHIFKLQDTYSKPMNGSFQNKEGKVINYLMGCYGIGVSRLLCAIIEEHHDPKGIILPQSITPFDVHILQISENNQVLDIIITSLNNANLTYLIDNRNKRAGEKFSDSDLIGLPYQIIIGKKSTQSEIELKVRETEQTVVLSIAKVIDLILKG